MIGLYGVAHHSPGHIFDIMRKDLGDKVQFHNDDTGKARAIIVDDFAVFKANVPAYKDRHAVVILCASPLLIGEVEGLQWLDAERPQSYRFMLQPINKGVLRQAITRAQNAKSKPLIDVSLKKIDLITENIKLQKKAGFLHLFNRFYMRSTGNKSNQEMKQAILRYLFGDISKKKLEKVIRKYVKPGTKGDDLYTQMMDYLNKTPQVFAALKYLRGFEKKAPTAKTAKKYGLDTYDLSYLTSAYKGMAKPGYAGHTNVQIRDAVLIRWADKEGGRKKRLLAKIAKKNARK